jgi:hypothetical protein
LLGGMLVAIAVLAGGMGQCFLLDEEVATPFWLVIAGTMVAAAQVGRPEAPVRVRPVDRTTATGGAQERGARR